jgi:hypothetical protein
MADLYSGDLAVLNTARVAQQDADTRASLANLNYLLGLAQNRTNQSKVDSEERLGNRRYQSEDYRTDEQFGAQRYGADQVLAGERDRSAAARYAADNNLMLGGWGIDRDLLVADENRKIEAAKMKNAAEMQTALIAGDVEKTKALVDAQTRLTIAQDNLRFQMGSGAGNGRVAQAQMEGELLREQAANEQAAVFADSLNKLMKESSRGLLGTGLWAKSAADNKASAIRSISESKYGDLLAVIDGPDGQPMVAVKPMRLGGFGATGGTATAQRQSLFPEVKLSPVTAPSILDSPNSATAFLPFSAPTAAPAASNPSPWPFPAPQPFRTSRPAAQPMSSVGGLLDRDALASIRPPGFDQTAASAILPPAPAPRLRLNPKGQIRMRNLAGNEGWANPSDVQQFLRAGYSYVQ